MSEPNSKPDARHKSGYKKVVSVNRHRLLVRTAFGWLLFQVVLYTLHFLITTQSHISISASASLILTALIVIAAQRQIAKRWLGIALMLVVFISLSSLSAEYGGLYSPVIIFLLFVPVATFMLVSRPAGWVATILVCGYFSVLGLLEFNNVHWNHHDITPQQNTLVTTLAMVLVMVCISGIGWYYSRLYDRFYLSLKKSNEDLKRTAQYKTEFLSSMSHEFRTPLNAIIGFSRRLSRRGDQPLGERDIRSLGAILRNGELLESLVNNVLKMAAIDAGEMVLKFDEADLLRLMRQWVNNFQPLASRKHLDLRFQPDTNLQASDAVLRVEIDIEKLHLVVDALLSNAINYTERGSVVVFLVHDETYFEIRVQDTGKGVAEQDIPRMFDRFKRLAEESRSANIGTGLGLAISQELTRLAGGELSASSRVGEGTTFTLRQPLRGTSTGVAFR